MNDNTLVRLNDHLAINRAFDIKEFNKLLESTLVRDTEWRQKQSFAPSSLGYHGQCPRYWHYAFEGAEFAYDPDALGVVNMNNGSSAGTRIAEMLDQAGILRGAEVEVTYDDPPIHGFIDALVMWQDSEMVVEVKTTKDATWNYRTNKNDVPGYQLLQLLIYMYVTGHERGFVLTENKNSNELFVYPVKMTEQNKKLVEDTFDWMRLVRANEELPTRPFNQSSMNCKNCPVKNICWDGYKRGSVNGTDPNPGTVTLLTLEEFQNRG